MLLRPSASLLLARKDLEELIHAAHGEACACHPAAAGRTYAAYGCVYIGAAILWLWAIEAERPSAWDLASATVALAGMAIIVLQPAR